MRLSKILLESFNVKKFRTFREVSTDELLLSLGFFSKTNGVITVPPLGTITMNRIEDRLRTISIATGFVEYRPPILQPKSYLESAGVLESFQQEVLQTYTSRGDQNLVVACTTEDIVLVLSEKVLLSHNNLPARFFGFGAKARVPLKKRGLARLTQFTTCDYTVLTINQNDIVQGANDFEEIMSQIISFGNIEARKAISKEGDYVDFLFPYSGGEKDDSEGEPTYSLGMYKQFDTKNRRMQRVMGVDSDLLQVGTYGLGLERLLMASAHNNRDELGLHLPPALAPFTVIVIPVGDKEEILYSAERLYTRLLSEGISAGLDDRTSMSLGARRVYAKAIGTAYVIAYGAKELTHHHLEIERRTGEKVAIPAENIISYLKESKI